MNTSQASSAVIGSKVWGQDTKVTVMRNVVINASYTGSTSTNPAICLTAKPTTMENVIVVGNATTDNNITGGTNCQFVADASSLTSVDGNNWNTNYWTVTSGALPVWNTKTNS